MEQTEKKTLSDHIGGFITAYRKAILGFLIFIFAAAAATGIVVSVAASRKTSGLTELDTLEFEYKKLQETEQIDEQKKDEIITGAKALSEKYSGIVRTRSAMFTADIYFQDKNWEQSRDYWITAAESQKKTYTAPICFYNAAVCSEEMGDSEKALLYFDTASANEGFPLASRALFNAGRIEESRGNYAQAVQRYEKLNDAYSGTDWANLAKSRLIALRASGKTE